MYVRTARRVVVVIVVAVAVAVGSPRRIPATAVQVAAADRGNRPPGIAWTWPAPTNGCSRDRPPPSTPPSPPNAGRYVAVYVHLYNIVRTTTIRYARERRVIISFFLPCTRIRTRTSPRPVVAGIKYLFDECIYTLACLRYCPLKKILANFPCAQ